MKNLGEESERYKALEKKRKEIGGEMGAMQEEAGLTPGHIKAAGAALNEKYSMGSVYTLARCEDLWKGCRKVLFEGTKTIHFRRRFEFAIPALQPELLSAWTA